MMIVATHGILKSPADTLDVDVRAFINATGISDSTIANALQTFVTTLKANSLWGKFDALYPFVGGTGFTHKFNLKNPLDDDSAFRLRFVGGWAHTATGIKANGASYADTYYNELANANPNNNHLSLYVRTNILISSVDMGVSDAATVATDISFTFLGGVGYRCFMRNANAQGNFAESNTSAFYINTRIAAGGVSAYRNGTSVFPGVYGANTSQNANYYIGACCKSTNGTAYSYSTREYGFSSIGKGLTAGEAVIFYNAVQTMQTSLGRQV